MEWQGARAAKRYVKRKIVEREKHHIKLHIKLQLNVGVGCARSFWPIFGFRNLLGAPRGRRGQFSVQSDNRFSGRGGGVGSLPRAWRRVGVPPAASVLKKFVRLASFSFAALWVFRLRRAEAASAVWIPHWHSEPFESEGTRAAKRYVNGEPRRAGDEFGIKLLRPDRLS